MNQITTRQERPLSLTEKFEVSKQLLNAYGTITFTVRLQHEPIDQGTTIESFYMRHFQPALTNMIDTYTPLSMVVRDKHKSTAHFEQLSSVDLKKVVAISNEIVPLNELIRQETTKEFDTEAQIPIWRLRVMAESPTTCTVVLVMNHAIGDGMSLTVFFRSFLQELNKNNISKETDSSLVPARQQKVALPYEKLNPPSASLFRDAIPELAKGLVPKIFPKPICRMITPVGTGGWKGDRAAIEGEPHNSEIGLIHVPADLWQPITAECKRRCISAHSIVVTTLLLAWRRLYPGEMTELTTPINCRGFCNPPLPKDLMGNYVSSITSYWSNKKFKREQDNIWEMATHYHHWLQKNKIKAAKHALLLKYLPSYPSSMVDYWYDKRKASPMGRQGGLELSDLGRYMIGQEGDTWKAEQIYFCQGAHTFNAGLGMNTICFENTLFCAFDWQKNTLDPIRINMFHDIFLKVMSEFLSQ